MLSACCKLREQFACPPRSGGQISGFFCLWKVDQTWAVLDYLQWTVFKGNLVGWQLLLAGVVMAYNGQAADVFSAGVVLFEALTGTLPFGDECALDEGANVLARALAMYALQDNWVRLPAPVVPA